MDSNGVKGEVIELFKKYNVGIEELNALSDLDVSKRMKFFLAKLDEGKCMDYSESDISLIKTLYSRWC